MKEEGIAARRKRRFVKTTDSKHNLPVAPNLLERDFTAEKPNQCWVGDSFMLGQSSSASAAVVIAGESGGAALVSAIVATGSVGLIGIEAREVKRLRPVFINSGHATARRRIIRLHAFEAHSTVIITRTTLDAAGFCA